MRLLVITRKIDSNDARAGFIYNWLKKLNQRLDKLLVICQERGDIVGLEQIDIYSLGKENLKKYPGFIKKVIYAYRFYKFIWLLKRRYDNVFVHMHWIYILLAGLFWRLSGKKIGFWYAHVKTTYWAKLASYFTDYIFSPSGHSFRFAQHKLRQTGHGIDTDIFRPLREKEKNEKRQIVSVGRLSKVKEYEILVEAINILVNKHGFDNFEINMIGQSANQEDFEYVKGLKNKIRECGIENYFDWLGDVANKDVYRFYQKGDIFVNQQPGGGFGKAVLEAMACGLTCVLATPVFNEVLGEYQKDTIFEPRNPEDMAEKLKGVFDWNEEQINGYKDLIIAYVRNNHNLDNLMDKIIKAYE